MPRDAQTCNMITAGIWRAKKGERDGAHYWAWNFHEALCPSTVSKFKVFEADQFGASRKTP